MQNRAQTLNRITGKLPLLPAAALCLMCLLLFCPAFSRVAWASAYESPQTQITANIQSDASLHVVELRSFHFEKQQDYISWTHSSFPKIATVQVNSISVATLDGPGQEQFDLQPVQGVSLEERFTEETLEPAERAWALDQKNRTCYLFLGETPEYLLVQYDYTITDALGIYNDCADLSWDYLAENPDCTSSDVSCSIALPAPAYTQPVAGKDMFAWGHGPENGNLSFGEDGLSLQYSNESVLGNQYAQAHIVLPTSWLENASFEAKRLYYGENHLAWVLKTEANWLDKGQVAQLNRWILCLVLGLLSLMVLAGGLLLSYVLGKEHRMEGQPEYLRHIPEGFVHPALAGRLWRWGRYSACDLVASVLNLAGKGVLGLHRGSYVPACREGDGAQPCSDYYLSRWQGGACEDLDELDEYTLHLLFDVVGKHEDALWLSSLYDYAYDNPKDFVALMEGWQELLDKRQLQEGFFEPVGWKWQRRLALLGFLYFVLTAIFALLAGNLWPLLPGALGSAALLVLSNFTTRASRQGQKLRGHCSALRCWMQDVSAGNEALGESCAPGSEERWNLAVYAYQFGVAEDLVVQLSELFPESFGTQDGPRQQEGSPVSFAACFAQSPEGDLEPFAPCLQNCIDDATRCAYELGFPSRKARRGRPFPRRAAQGEAPAQA